MARATYDFDRWPDLWQWAFALPEPGDRSLRGSGLARGDASLGSIPRCIWASAPPASATSAWGCMDSGTIAPISVKSPATWDWWFPTTAFISANRARRRGRSTSTATTRRRRPRPAQLPHHPLPGQRHPERRGRNPHLPRPLAQRRAEGRGHHCVLLRRSGAGHAAPRPLARWRSTPARNRRDMLRACYVTGRQLRTGPQCGRRGGAVCGPFGRANAAHPRLQRRPACRSGRARLPGALGRAAPDELAGQAVRVSVNLEQKAETRPRVYALYVAKGKRN